MPLTTVAEEYFSDTHSFGNFGSWATSTEMDDQMFVGQEAAGHAARGPAPSRKGGTANRHEIQVARGVRLTPRQRKQRAGSNAAGRAGNAKPGNSTKYVSPYRQQALRPKRATVARRDFREDQATIRFNERCSHGRERKGWTHIPPQWRVTAECNAEPEASAGAGTDAALPVAELLVNPFGQAISGEEAVRAAAPPREPARARLAARPSSAPAVRRPPGQASREPTGMARPPPPPPSLPGEAQEMLAASKGEMGRRLLGRLDRLAVEEEQREEEQERDQRRRSAAAAEEAARHGRPLAGQPGGEETGQRRVDWHTGAYVVRGLTPKRAGGRVATSPARRTGPEPQGPHYSARPPQRAVRPASAPVVRGRYGTHRIAQPQHLAWSDEEDGEDGGDGEEDEEDEEDEEPTDADREPRPPTSRPVARPQSAGAAPQQAAAGAAPRAMFSGGRCTAPASPLSTAASSQPQPLARPKSAPPCRAAMQGCAAARQVVARRVVAQRARGQRAAGRTGPTHWPPATGLAELPEQHACTVPRPASASAGRRPEPLGPAFMRASRQRPASAGPAARTTKPANHGGGGRPVETKVLSLKAEGRGHGTVRDHGTIVRGRGRSRGRPLSARQLDGQPDGGSSRTDPPSQHASVPASVPASAPASDGLCSQAWGSPRRGPFRAAIIPARPSRPPLRRKTLAA